jgi:integrase
MNLFKLKTGYYYIFYKAENGKQNKASTHTKNKKEAFIFLSKFQENLELRNNKNFKGEQNLSEVIRDYLKHVSIYYTYKTYLDYKTTFNFFQSYLSKDICLNEISTDLIRDYLSNRKNNTSIYAYRKDYINLKAFFNYAISKDYLRTNPLKKIKSIRIPQKYPKYFTDVEIKSFIETVDEKDFLDIILFALNTGIRQGEIINLRWKQIDFEKNNLLITNTEYFETKNKRARIIPLNKEALRIIEARNKDNQFVFTYNTEKIKADYLQTRFKKWIITSEVNPKLSFHSLRHTFASNLVSKGISIYHVSKLLGHSSVETTQIYANLNNKDLQEAVDVLV